MPVQASKLCLGDWDSNQSSHSDSVPKLVTGVRDALSTALPRQAQNMHENYQTLPHDEVALLLVEKNILWLKPISCPESLCNSKHYFLLWNKTTRAQWSWSGSIPSGSGFEVVEVERGLLPGPRGQVGWCRARFGRHRVHRQISQNVTC